MHAVAAVPRFAVAFRQDVIRHRTESSTRSSTTVRAQPTDGRLCSICTWTTWRFAAMRTRLHRVAAHQLLAGPSRSIGARAHHLPRKTGPFDVAESDREGRCDASWSRLRPSGRPRARLLHRDDRSSALPLRLAWSQARDRRRFEDSRRDRRRAGDYSPATATFRSRLGAMTAIVLSRGRAMSPDAYCEKKPRAAARALLQLRFLPPERRRAITAL